MPRPCIKHRDTTREKRGRAFGPSMIEQIVDRVTRGKNYEKNKKRYDRRRRAKAYAVWVGQGVASCEKRKAESRARMAGVSPN